MLLRLIKNNRLSGIIFIVFLMLVLWLKSFLDTSMIVRTDEMPFYKLLFGEIEEKHFLSLIIGMFVYGILLVLIIRFNVIHFLLEDRSFMPAVFFLLLIASFPHSFQITPVLISSVFLVSALLILIRGDEHRANPFSLFNATLILTIGSLFYLKLIWFIPFLWITAAIIRPLKWRGIVNPILVVIMMAAFHLTYFWVFKDDLSLFSKLISENLSKKHSSVPEFQIANWIIFGYLSLLTFISSVYLLSRFQVRKIIIRKLYQVLFLLFVYSLLFYFFISELNQEVIIFMAIPLAYLFSNYFQRRRNHWSHNLIIWIWLLLIAFMQIYPFLMQ